MYFREVVPVLSNFYVRFGKGLFDIFLVTLATLGLAPIFLLILLLLSVVWRGRPFFCHERAGREGEPFMLWKFKSMDTEGKVQLPIGAWLRRTSLDEIPQLWNIWRGEVSFVGPRPLPVSYVDFYSDEHKKRLKVKPGLTGWAQVKGRNSLDWKERFDLDVFYKNRLSFFFDLYILFLTPAAIFRSGQADFHDQSLKPFEGYDD